MQIVATRDVRIIPANYSNQVFINSIIGRPPAAGMVLPPNQRGLRQEQIGEVRRARTGNKRTSRVTDSLDPAHSEANVAVLNAILPCPIIHARVPCTVGRRSVVSAKIAFARFLEYEAASKVTGKIIIYKDNF